MRSNRVSSREFELDYFPEIQRIEKFVSSYPEVDKLKGKFERRFSPNFQRTIGIMTEVNSDKFEKSPKFIDGSFERTNFLAEKEVLRSYLKFPNEYSNWFEENFEFNMKKYVVAIHVRRTDYLNLGHIYNVLDKTYYLKAVDSVHQSSQNVAFHLFSDDPDGAKSWLGESISIEKVISPPINIPSGEVLRLMSTYDAIITANSTFSWWAAYIGSLNNNVKSIFIPKKFSNLANDNPEEYLSIGNCSFI
jgi:hypothetical protein